MASGWLMLLRLRKETMEAKHMEHKHEQREERTSHASIRHLVSDLVLSQID